MRALLASMLVAMGCTTISIARLDRCTVRKTATFVSSREEILFCDDAPAWSNDRAVRLTQECLYQQRQMQRERMFAAERSGTPMSGAGEEAALKECWPASLRTLQAENESLRDRLARADAVQTRMEARHAELENGLSKALNRPINAVADARATSDSGSGFGSDARTPDAVRDNCDSPQPKESIRRTTIASATPHRARSDTFANAKRPVCPAKNDTTTK